MGIRSKPKQRDAFPSHVDEQHVNALIEKGGTVAASSTPRAVSRLMLVQLRLSSDIIERIDQIRKQRSVPPSRHAWIVEALLDKLTSEQR
jgi:hypothetical protein